MRVFNNLKFKPRQVANQQGMASIMITGILIALLTLVVVSFSVISRREALKSVQNQTAQAAYYAAESGINDAASYLAKHPTATATNCSDLLGSGKINPNLTSDGSTKYTCITIDTTPPDLQFANITAEGSQIVKVVPTSNLDSLMFSWQATDQDNDHFVSSGQAFYDETTWASSKYAPVLRVSIYPIPSSSKSLDFANSNAKTFFLYPNGPSGSNTVDSISYSSDSGSVQPANCGNSNAGSFGTTDYDCNLIISDMPNYGAGGSFFYVRLTPLYTAADIKLQGATGSGKIVSFKDTQGLIDVTAQSASALKRLQARVDLSGGENISPGDNGIAEDALRSPFTICKRLQVPLGNSPVYQDGTSNTNCQGVTFQKVTAPDMDVSASGISRTDATLQGTNINLNNGIASSCSFSFRGTNYDCMSKMPSGPSTTPFNISQAVSGLSAGTSYSFTLCITNQAGQTCKSASFRTLAPPVDVNVSITRAQTSGGDFNAKIVDHGDAATFTGCGASYNRNDGSGYHLFWHFNASGQSVSGTWQNKNQFDGTTLNFQSGWLVQVKCDATDGASGTGTGTMSTPAIILQVVCALDGTPSGCMHTNGPHAGWACYDGTHTYTMCVSWQVHQDGFDDFNNVYSGNPFGCRARSVSSNSSYGTSGWTNFGAPNSNTYSDDGGNGSYWTKWYNKSWGWGGKPGQVYIQVQCYGMNASGPADQNSPTVDFGTTSNGGTGGSSGGGTGGGGGTTTVNCTYGGSITSPPGCVSCPNGGTATSLDKCPCVRNCLSFVEGNSRFAYESIWKFMVPPL